jgi:hypothetical protein
MNQEQFHILLEAYVTGTISKENRTLFFSLLEDPVYRNQFEKVLEAEWNRAAYEDAPNEEIAQLIHQQVMHTISGAKVVPLRRTPVFRMRNIAAAAVLTFIIAGAYFFMTQRSSDGDDMNIGANNNPVGEQTPGSNKAVLILNDGKSLLLDSTKSGILARQGETTLVISNGVLTYKAEGKAGGVSFNTVRTPNGAQYHLRLADGTDVWLNAASSLRFPTAFQGADRIVAITGEAYFEVAHDAAKPFRVQTNGSQVEVLGTRFNVNAYEDGGQWKTTLIQGKVRVTRDKAKVVLLPGHQARLNAVTGRFDVKAANIEEALAWKNGNFQFENTDIKTVMNQIARWYNVEVVFKDGIPEGHYRFIIPRNTPVSSLITILNAGGIECKLEDKRIIVLK